MKKKIVCAVAVKKWVEGEVLAHIAGASGSGKTTIGKRLASSYSSVIVKDLDEFDDESEVLLGWPDVKKSDYTDEMLMKSASLKQNLLDDFIKQSCKPIILVGHHMEGNHVLHIPTTNRFILNVDAKTSAWRGYLRSQKDPNYRKALEQLPEDENEAQEIIDWLVSDGYKPISHDEILRWASRIMG